MVLIRGIEPSMRWRTFCEQILEVCHSLEVNRIVLLGALLADVPVHPAAADQRQRVGRGRCRAVRGADPVRGADRHRGRAAGGLPPRRDGRAVVLGARAALREQPAVSEGDARRCCTASRTSSTCRCRWPTCAEEADEWEERVRAAAEQDAELAEYVRELEERVGDEGIEPLTGDEIASEFEKYLRRRGGGTAS